MTPETLQEIKDKLATWLPTSGFAMSDYYMTRPLTARADIRDLVDEVDRLNQAIQRATTLAEAITSILQEGMRTP